MHIQVIQGALQETSADAIVVNLFEGVTTPGGATGAVDRALGGQISELIQQGDFRGKRKEVTVLYTRGALPAPRVILVGLGKAEAFTLEGVREAAALAVQQARKLGVTSLATLVHGAGVGGLDPQAAAEATVEGSLLGLYRFTEFKTTDEENHKPDLETLLLVEFDAAKLDAMRAGAQTGEILASATNFARDLINRPANVATPSHLAAEAQRIAAETGLRCTVLTPEEMETIGMHLLLSVARGSHEPARFIILEHNAERTDLPTVALVGKAITFDTGGISLKPAEGMEAMRSDMSGGAAVLGAMYAVARLNLPLRVIGLVPATENMPGGRATKPGDIVRSLKGLTVEIINTDAEGRLILADALTYAGRFNPKAMVDIATLTGACVIALGHAAAGVMGDDELVNKLRAAGERSGDRVWPLPLFEDYKEQIKSDLADLKNVGGRPGGALTAGMFLKQFVPDGIVWAHVDMAGMGLEEKGRPHVPKGGAGYGVRLFVDLLRNWRE